MKREKLKRLAAIVDLHVSKQGPPPEEIRRAAWRICRFMILDGAAAVGHEVPATVRTRLDEACGGSPPEDEARRMPDPLGRGDGLSPEMRRKALADLLGRARQRMEADGQQRPDEDAPLAYWLAWYAPLSSEAESART